MSVRVDASAATVHWGYLDAALAPAAAIDSGEVVTISTVSGPPDALPPPPALVPRALYDIHAAKTRRMLPGHMCTGPIAVRGAKPGQVLQVDIEDIALHYDWGYVACRPLRGALPHDFAEPHMIHVALERNRMVGRLPWGTEIPLRPFFGVMANAPPRAWGTVSSIQPRQFGGNMDNKELVAGATLYLPVFVDNALFSVGDGHGAQGDGEVCGTAIECGMTTRIVIDLVADPPIPTAHAVTPAGRVTFGFSADLNEAMAQALAAMVDWLQGLFAVDRATALALASPVVDLRVTQVANQVWGVHAVLPDGALTRG